MDRPPPTRLLRRAGSGRFPIKISTSSGLPPVENDSPGSSTSSQRQTSSVSLRSHHRLESPQLPQPPQIPQTPQRPQNGAVRHPAETSVGMSNERLRSNSEGRVPGIRIKRMGIVSRKMSELGTVDEARSSRFGHYRGLSHGSVMQDKHTNGVASSEDGSSSPISPADHERRRGHRVRRLSSLPEHKRDPRSANRVLEGVRGILYSLALVHPHISSLVGVVREGASKRSSLELVFYNASTHTEQLDRDLQRLNAFAEDEDEDLLVRASEGVVKTCLTCVMAYQHVGTLLLQNVHRVVTMGDSRYVRTLVLLVYGGLTEVRNASLELCMDYGGAYPAYENGLHDQSATPTQEQPRPGSRLRSEAIIKQSGGLKSEMYAPSLPSTRSNGSSRAGSIASTVMATPRSGESFLIPSMPTEGSSRATTTQSADETREERQFEKIFLKLTQADEIALRTVPTVKQQFVRCIEVCKKQETEKELRSMWTTLDSKCSFTIQMAEHLKVRLSTIKLKEPGVVNDREFWQLCNAFVKAFVETALLVKDAKRLELIPTDILQLLRPVSRAVKEVGILIETSPWKHLAASQPAFVHQVQPPSHPIMPAYFPTSSQISSGGYGFNHPGPNSSPYVSPIPATPLSAALGPAAQATVPSAAAVPQRNGLYSGPVSRSNSLLSKASRSMTTAVTHPHGHNPNMMSPLSSRAHPRIPG